MASIEENIQHNIISLLLSEKITERDLAESAGISQGYINKIKNGRLNFLVLHAINQLSKRYGFTIDEFINSNINNLEKNSPNRQTNQIKLLALSQSENGSEIKLIDFELSPSDFLKAAK